jgi:hypothetical protein
MTHLEANPKSKSKLTLAQRRAIRRHLWTIIAPILTGLLFANAGVWLWLYGAMKGVAEDAAVEVAKKHMEEKKDYVQFFADRAKEGEERARKAARDAEQIVDKFRDLEGKATELTQKAEQAKAVIDKASKEADNVNKLKEAADLFQREKNDLPAALAKKQEFIKAVTAAVAEDVLELKADRDQFITEFSLLIAGLENLYSFTGKQGEETFPNVVTPYYNAVLLRNPINTRDRQNVKLRPWSPTTQRSLAAR